jgi:hypothetical protein
MRSAPGQRDCSSEDVLLATASLDLRASVISASAPIPANSSKASPQGLNLLLFGHLDASCPDYAVLNGVSSRPIWVAGLKSALSLAVPSTHGSLSIRRPERNILFNLLI